MNGIVRRYDRPLLFYGLATALPWSCWFVAAYLSHRAQPTADAVRFETAIGFLGLLVPMAVAFVLMLSNEALRSDLSGRLFNFADSRPVYWLAAAFLLPASLLAAMTISLAWGYSLTQFQLAPHPSFTSGVLPVWLLLIASPIIEELGWHTYGTDCLVSRFTLFSASLLFALFWAVWHAPLALIKDYYQANVVQSGLLYTLNFPVSILPFVVIMNWLYYRAERNIWIAALFHFTAGYFNELFAVHPMSKVIQTGLLLVVAAVIMLAERKLFFGGKLRRERLAPA